MSMVGEDYQIILKRSHGYSLYKYIFFKISIKFIIYLMIWCYILQKIIILIIIIIIKYLIK